MRPGSTIAMPNRQLLGRLDTSSANQLRVPSCSQPRCTLEASYRPRPAAPRGIRAPSPCLVKEMTDGAHDCCTRGPGLGCVSPQRPRAPPDTPKPEHGASIGATKVKGPAPGNSAPVLGLRCGRSQPIDIGKTSSASLRAAGGLGRRDEDRAPRHVEDAVNNGTPSGVNATDGDPGRRRRAVRAVQSLPCSSEHTVGGKRFRWRCTFQQSPPELP